VFPKNDEEVQEPDDEEGPPMYSEVDANRNLTEKTYEEEDEEPAVQEEPQQEDQEEDDEEEERVPTPEPEPIAPQVAVWCSWYGMDLTHGSRWSYITQLWQHLILSFFRFSSLTCTLSLLFFSVVSNHFGFSF
jgi:hypothetical protein